MTTVGYPFLVGRTYTTGYRTLLAPELLADVGALARLVVPGRDGMQRTTVDGRPITLVSRTERLGPSDVDEHGRPVVLVYGFVSVTPLDRPDGADLSYARAEALAVYRRARAADDTSHEVSAPFELSSPPAPVAATSPSPPGRRGYLLVAAAVAVVALVAAGWLLFRPATTYRWTGEWRSTELTVTLDCSSSRCTTASAKQPSGCRYDLAYRSGLGGAALTFQATPARDGCLAAGTVTLTQTSGTTAALRWRAGDDLILAADLSRTPVA